MKRRTFTTTGRPVWPRAIVQTLEDGSIHAYPMRLPPVYLSTNDRIVRARLLPVNPATPVYDRKRLAEINARPAGQRPETAAWRRRSRTSRVEGLVALPVTRNPLIEFPADATMFDAKSNPWVNFANGVATTVLVWTVPNGVLGVLRFIGIAGYYGVPSYESQDVNTTAVTLWINGVPHPFWNGAPGTQGIYSRVAYNAIIPISGGDVLTVRVTHADAVNNWTYGARLFGWTWPRQRGEVS